MRIEECPGYHFEAHEPDAPRLFAPNGKVVACFGPGWSKEQVERAARNHAEAVDAGIRRLEKLLGRSRRPKPRLSREGSQ